MIARHFQFAVDLVTDDDHAVSAADVGHSLKVLTRPDTTARVVRVAEQQHLGHRIGGTSLKILEINVPSDLVTFRVVDQFIDREFAEIVLGGGEETVVRRTLDDHLWQLTVRATSTVRLLHNLSVHDLVLRQSLDHHRHRRNDPSDVEVPILLRVPPSAALPPVDSSLVVRIRHVSVAENLLIHTFFQHIHNLRSHLEVHIRHPKRNHILRNRSDRTLSVPLDAVRAAPYRHLVKVIFSHNITIYIFQFPVPAKKIAFYLRIRTFIFLKSVIALTQASNFGRTNFKDSKKQLNLR